MRATGQSFSERISRWETLVVSLEGEQPLIPHEANQLAALQQLLLEARQIGVQQEAARAVLRELTNQMSDLTSQGDKIRRRLGASLHSRLGFTADALIRYGFKPVNVVRRPPAALPVPQQPEPQEREAAAS